MQLRLKTGARFLSAIFSGIGTKARKDGLATYIDLDFSNFVPLPVIDPTQAYIPVQSLDGSFARVSVATILTSSQNSVIKTTPGPVNVSTIDGSILVNKTIGEPTQINLPSASLKVGPVLVADLKRDASTNNITINSSGADTIAGLPNYVIAGDGGSVFLRPVPGVGYVI